MTGIVSWAAAHARMVLAFVLLSLVAGWMSYTGLPKEGEPDIEIPALFVSVPFPGISAEDSERLIVKPMETELSDLDGLKKMTATAAEGYGGVAMEFEFGWDKTKTLADVRDAMNAAQANFPDGAERYSLNEINFSEFPILIVSLSGPLPERTLLRTASDLQDRLEGLDAVLSATLAGHRDEMVEVVIDPLRLESYDVTAADIIDAVRNNNQLIAAGEVESAEGAFAVKIPSSFDDQRDIYDLPVKVNGDRVVTLGDLADIRLTFEDAEGTARFGGAPAVALQVVKRKGFNIIDTAALVRETVAEARAEWPEELRDAIRVDVSNDQSRTVASMVGQLEGSVLTAIALVMIVVLASLGLRSALLVGFAIPTSFLLCFILLGAMGISISNIVMFGLILAVGMLVDGAIVVVEYADRRIEEGEGPMRAFTEAARRMFWPIVSSTATTLCAFLPMLFWPGVAGEFMGMLPVTLIFVLSASLIVALVYLPVVGGVAGRISRAYATASDRLRPRPVALRAGLALLAGGLAFLGLMLVLNPAYLGPALPRVLGGLIFLAGTSALAIAVGALARPAPPEPVRRRTLTPFGRVVAFIVGNPVMPFVAMAAVVGFVVFTFGYFGRNNNGVEFFVETEPEQALVYVRARGNLSLAEKDALLRDAEEIALATPGIRSVFAFAGEGGINNNTGGGQAPLDTVAQVQVEPIPWEERPAAARAMGVSVESLDGDVVLAELQERLAPLPGIQVEVTELAQGPAQGKPVFLQISGDDWGPLQEAARVARERFEATPGLIDVEDSTPLPGIDWQIDVDVEAAGRYGADVSLVGAMVQLVTRGLTVDTMRVPSSDDEIDIRVRLPEDDRVLSTLDSLKLRTSEGLVPLSNFVTRTPVPSLGQIDRVDQKRVFDIKADVLSNAQKVTDAEGALVAILREGDGLVRAAEASYALLDAPTGLAPQGLTDGLADGTLSLAPLNANERIAALTTWLETEPFPEGVSWIWTGDQEDQAESQAFLQTAFLGALGLMFIILLAQFDSVYNAILVLLAVVLSTAGCLWGMIVMGQPFSIIMTGTGIVALAGIVVNNNIVLIDTYQEYAARMPRIEAIVRTAEDRIRPVLLTTITTMAGLAPMMLGLSLDFVSGGYSVDSPTALWWKQLATAVVFGLGVATVLTLIFTPSALAARVWISRGMANGAGWLRARRSEDAARDRALSRDLPDDTEIVWETDPPKPRLPRFRRTA